MNHLTHYFQQFDIRFSDTGYHRLKNPFDNSRHRNMVVNFDQNFVQDWKTGYYKSIAGFVSDHSGITYKDALDFVGIIEVPILTKNPSTFDYTKVNDILPEEYIPITHEGYMGDRCRNYWIGRGFNIDFLSDKGWGFCEEGLYMGRTILPYRIKGKLVYFTARDFIGLEPKYLFPDSTKIGVGKSEILYNQDALVLFNEGWLVEGIVDAETVGDNCIASGGWKLSDHQISLISNSAWKTLNIIADQGFELKATATGLYFKDKMDVYIHSVPKGFNDVNACGFENVILNKNKL